MSEAGPSLADRTCVPCEEGAAPLSAARIRPLFAELDGWTVVDDHHLEKNFKFRNFVTALDFVNRIGAIAEQESHHPDVMLAWGRVVLQIWTHSVDGLSEADFVLAAKADRERAASR